MSRFIYVLIFILIYCPIYGQLVGGEINVRHINQYENEVTTIKYFKSDPDSTENDSILYYGDGDDDTLSAVDTNAYCNGIYNIKYVTNHLYTGPGKYYIQTGMQYQDTCFINLEDTLIDSKISADIDVNPFTNFSYGTNFQAPPIFYADSGKPFQMNMTATPVKGDSLSFSLLSGGTNYNFPQGAKINPLSGEFIWGVLPANGTYLFFCQVQTFYQRLLVGEQVRAFTVFVENVNNTGVFSGTGNWPVNVDGDFESHASTDQNFSLSFVYSDPQADSVKLQAFGEPLVAVNPATFSKIQEQTSISGLFEWTPESSQRRTYPYVMTFRGTSYKGGNCMEKDLTVMIYVDYPLHLSSSADKNLLLEIYPNPTTGTFTVKSAGQGVFTLTDIAGRQIATGRLNEPFTLQGQPAGMYFVKAAGQSKKLLLTR